MSETGRKLSGGYAALLAAVAVGALVVACDTPVPTEVREAFEQVMAEEEAKGADAEQEDWIERFLGATAFGPDPAPLLYVDGVHVQSEEDLFAMELFLADVETGQIQREFAESIERIEVLKGAAAAKLYGEEAAGGVIQIFTKASLPEPEAVVVPSIRVGGTVQLKPREDLTIENPGVPSLKTLTVRAARDRRRVALRYVGAPSVETLVVTRRSERPDWDRWLTENAAGGAPTGSGPVIYIDGVRVDGSLTGLNELNPGDIDHIDVIKGEDATEKYGEEGSNGVILIFTKKKSSDTPSTGRPG